MSLTTPLIFMIIFIVLLMLFTDVFSLLLYAIFLSYVFIYYDTFFTDTMSATVLGVMQLLTGTVALAGFAKTIIISSEKYKTIFGDVEE